MVRSVVWEWKFLSPGDVWGACCELRCAWPHLPNDCVVMAAVDPGVGTERRAVVVSIGNRSLVAPDNGLAAAVSEATEAVVLEWRRMGVDEPSKTFHGRDLFAPAAARLARGADVHDFGDETEPGTLVPCPLPEPVSTGSRCAGQILHVDRFGNLVTNVRCEDEPGIVSATWRTGWTARRVRTYSEARPDEVVLLEGSADYLELAVNCGSAAEATGLERGDPVLFNKLGIRN